MIKLTKLKVLIVGMRGLGVECAKNLVLAGPASVAIYDPTTVTINDLGSNFYLNESHVGKISRAAASLGQLQELNSYVKVSVVDKLTLEDHKNYSVVCYTENLSNIAHLFEVNSFCHTNKVGFILSETLGAAGYAFLDYGDQHLITDPNGEPTESYIITSITNEENAIITINENKINNYEEGDFVKFVEVVGMNEINNREPIEIIKVIGPYAF